MLNNVKNPVRTLKIAGPLGLGICAVLYLLANVAYFAYVHMLLSHKVNVTLRLRRAASKEEIAKSGVTVASLFFHNVFGSKAQKALTVFVALSALGNVITIVSTQLSTSENTSSHHFVGRRSRLLGSTKVRTLPRSMKEFALTFHARARKGRNSAAVRKSLLGFELADGEVTSSRADRAPYTFGTSDLYLPNLCDVDHSDRSLSSSPRRRM